MNKTLRFAFIGMVTLGMLISIPCFSQTPNTRIPSVVDSIRRTVLDSLRSSMDIDSLRQLEDTVLRIRNLNPYITLHVDSTMYYTLEINKNPSHYFWYLRNSPVGLKINKDNGLLTFKADKSYFLSGKLKYDYPYKVAVGVQNLHDPNEKVDTSFTLLFFTTDIIPSRLKPSVTSMLFIEEGDTVNFRIECEEGSFPVETISFYSNMPLKNYSTVKKCDDEFSWSPGYDFIRDGDSVKQKLVLLNFVGMNKFFAKDTAIVRVVVKDALNYPVMLQEYQRTVKTVSTYVLQLKYSFVQLDKKIKNNKGTRTTFDMTSASTAVGGTAFSSSASLEAQNIGKILPSAGVALVPVKEAVAPTKSAEQNAASLVRSSIKRLEYQLHENALSTDTKDMDIVKKINKLKDEMKQIQIQLIDVPSDENTSMTEEQLNEYFNSKKVTKKYKLK
ncbi:MAG TPA: hypothetical protein VG890_10415 [Puia sp.]|nr:hypothetical protein [Puia sp.]